MSQKRKETKGEKGGTIGGIVRIAEIGLSDNRTAALLRTAVR